MQTIKKAVVVVNGRFAHEERLLPVLDSADYIIAADGGANWLDAYCRTPHGIVGDMDSVEPALLTRLEQNGCRVVRYPAHKDETDAELALATAAAMDPAEIVILGALGGRIDHALGNLSLLSMPVLRGIKVYVFDGQSMLWLATGCTEIHGKPGDVVSLIPWGGDACAVHTEGLAYPLRGETLPFGPSRGISNVLVGSYARISLSSGQLLVVHTPLEHLEDVP